MAIVFISYNRQVQKIAEALATDIETLGHTAWLDQQLTGGQDWWNKILEAVRGCDVFVFVVDPSSMHSTACQREWGYAADLGKPILPVLVSDGVSTSLLPPALSQIQFVDYRRSDRDSALRLGRALGAVPPPKPLPDPLPPPPEVPASYLGRVALRVMTDTPLSFEQQSALLLELKSGLSDPMTVADTRELLKTLKKRRELLASIDKEIDVLLAGSLEEPQLPPTVSASTQVPVSKEGWIKAQGTRISSLFRTSTNREKRTLGALIGVAVGFAFWFVQINVGMESSPLYMAGGVIAGAIGGMHLRVSCIALGGALLFLFLRILFDTSSELRYQPEIRHFLICMDSVCAIVGAIVGNKLKRSKGWA